jgi:hypothetical protein
MPNRLMTPFCFASVMAAMLLAEGTLTGHFPKTSTEPEDRARPPATGAPRRPGRERVRRAAADARGAPGDGG